METIKDIIAEMRIGVNALQKYGVKPRNSDEWMVFLAMFADRIESAYQVEKLRWVEANAGLAKLVDLEKIPTGNTAKMREALKLASYFLHEHNMGAVRTRDGMAICCWDVAKVVDAALAAQLRNCDIGTVDEQAKRFYNFCKKYKLPDDACEASCPMQMSLNCELAWAQMEYKKEAK